MIKKWLAGLVLATSLLLGAVAWAQPQIPPVPTSGSIFVRDYAGVLSEDTKTQLGFLGSQLKGKTKAHVLAVVVKTTGDSPPADYALAIMRQWGVGDKTLNNGVVILVAVNDKTSRIEVGYGLEGRINDAKAGRIQDEYMIPYFQRGDYDKGLLNGYYAVVDEVAKEYGAEVKLEGRAKTSHTPQPAHGEPWWDALPWWAKIAVFAGAIGLFVIDWLFFGGQFTWLILALIFRRGGGGGGGGGGGFGGGSGGGGGADRRW